MNLKERLFDSERALESEAEARIVQEFAASRELVAQSPEQFVTGITNGLTALASDDFLPRLAKLATDAADQIAVEAGYISN